MNLIPFTKFLISAQQNSKGVKNATGLIKDWESMLDINTIEWLRQNHQNIFTFLAFDVEIDKDIFEYIESGSLSSESGEKIMVLYAVNKIVESPLRIKANNFIDFIQVKTAANPNLEIIKFSFGEQINPTVPGLLIFDNVAFSKKALYVPFIGQKDYSKPDCLRKVISLLEKAESKLDDDNDSIIDKVSTQLLKSKIDYKKNSNYTFGECIIHAYRLLKELKSDLVAVFA